MIELKVKNSILEIIKNEQTTTNAINFYKLKFTFDSGWDIYSKKSAIFFNNNKGEKFTHSIDKNGIVYTPKQILDSAIPYYVSVCGENLKERATTNTIRINVVESGFSDNNNQVGEVIIDVENLPTENINTDAFYAKKVGDNYELYYYRDKWIRVSPDRAYIVALIGLATHEMEGLMSAKDKTNLDMLVTAFGSETGDPDKFVNTIREILKIFEQYPEGLDIMQELNKKANATDVTKSLALKVDKTTFEQIERELNAEIALKANKTDVAQEFTNYYKKGEIDSKETAINNKITAVETKADNAQNSADSANAVAESAVDMATANSEDINTLNQHIEDGGFVQTTQQSLTKEKQIQACENIGAVRKEYADNIFATKAEQETLKRRVDNLYGGFVKFHTDDTVAYQKDILPTALSNGIVKSLGGMSRKRKNLIPWPYESMRNSVLYPDGTGVIEITGLTITVQSDGGVHFKGTNTGSAIFFYLCTKDFGDVTFGTDRKNNNGTYVISGGLDSNLYVVYNANTKKTYFTIKANTPFDIVLYPQMELGTTSTSYEKYYEGIYSAKTTAIVSNSANLFDYKTALKAKGFVENGDWLEGNSITVPYTIYTNATGKSGIVSCKYSLQSVGEPVESTFVFLTRYKDGSFQYWGQPKKTAEIQNITASTSNNSKIIDHIEIRGNGGTYKIKDIMLNLGEPLPYTPYRDPIPYSIPNEIQIMKGYGESNPDNPKEYNYIDTEKQEYVYKGQLVNGVWQASLEERIPLPVPFNRFIKVEAGGNLTFENEHKKPVPSTIKYEVKK